ncbi:hypothetical protein [Kitasatospora sp. NPDC091207]|uniref:hypothetical protein n=1 Tax=Kitasatospora sp. NPDC091207 TaxID=3364083 RepID=UPI0038077CE9
MSDIEMTFDESPEPALSIVHRFPLTPETDNTQEATWPRPTRIQLPIPLFLRFGTRRSSLTTLSTTAMPAGVDIVAGHSDFATYASQFTGFRSGPSERYRADYVDNLHQYGGKIVRYPGLDTAKPDHTFDENTPTKGILKVAVDWPAS